MAVLKLDVVSAEKSLYSGTVKMVVLPGEAGELGVLPGHTPLITRIRPGTVRITREDGTQEVVFVAGGILEVQPYAVTVLADVAVRLEELDAAKAEASRKKAQETLKNASTPQEAAAIEAELALLQAQVVALQRYRDLKSHH
ncbi:ATP synthase epsilon chain [Oligella sp. MSHR50489EDL]|uniref:F0F1 ATP synthase subunit epsilon n=1 Tax=Oligella sp. MSHR50489EDL TaxID=3139409 RepID=UPI003D81543F